MCGIAGILGTPEHIARGPDVLAALRHRGPDGQGTWQTELGGGRRLWLGHRRLAILDLSPNGAQPMVDPERGNVVVYNGEIYNFRDLRARLEGLGERFTSSGDTEVLLRGYAQWGDRLWADLDGIFAVLMWDPRRRRLVVARDHAGIKPLYHAALPGGGLAFASEVRALGRALPSSPEVDPEAVAGFLRFGSIPEPRTLRLGLRAFPAGHSALIDPSTADAATTLQPAMYWSPEEAAAGPATDPAQHGPLLRATVNDQLVADVPVGVFLSAGIDSTLLLESIAPATRRQVHAFTVGGELTEEDEATLAAANAERIGVPHRLVRLGGAELHAWVADGLRAMDQPSADGINTYLVSRASRATGIIVALGGTGADEVHGGYSHFRSLPSIAALVRATGGLARLGGGIGAALLGLRNPVAGERARLLTAAAPDAWDLVNERRRFLTPAQARRWWPAGPPIDRPAPRPAYDDEAWRSLPFRSQLAAAEMHGYLRHTLLRDADWASMAPSQELRVPYLGRRYLEFALRLPWRVRQGTARVNKPLLAGLVSPASRAVVARRKTGFLLDTTRFLQGPFAELARASWNRLNVDLGFELQADRLLAGLSQERPGPYSRRLWALLALGHHLGGGR